MQPRRVILIIVEGSTEEISIGSIIDDLIPEINELVVLVVHSDITSEFHSEPGNIKSKLGNFINQKISTLKTFTKDDIKEIIHIVDTDGAFVDDSVCYQDENCNELDIIPIQGYVLVITLI